MSRAQTVVRPPEGLAKPARWYRVTTYFLNGQRVIRLPSRSVRARSFGRARARAIPRERRRLQVLGENNLFLFVDVRELRS